MNHDEKNPDPKMQTWIEPELEARVVAWVAGEASAFEIAELERLIAEKPELAIFKRRIEAVHGLVGEAARPDREPLRMTEERRAKLLETLGAKAGPAPLQERIATLPRIPSPWSWRAPRIYFALSGALAACVVFLLTFTTTKKPVYQAQAALQFEKPDTIVTTAGVVDQAVRSDVDLNTYVQILNSEKIKQRVEDSLRSDARAAVARIAKAEASGGRASAQDKALLQFAEPPESRVANNAPQLPTPVNSVVALEPSEQVVTNRSFANFDRAATLSAPAATPAPSPAAFLSGVLNQSDYRVNATNGGVVMSTLGNLSVASRDGDVITTGFGGIHLAASASPVERSAMKYSGNLAFSGGGATTNENGNVTVGGTISNAQNTFAFGENVNGSLNGNQKAGGGQLTSLNENGTLNLGVTSARGNIAPVNPADFAFEPNGGTLSATGGIAPPTDAVAGSLNTGSFVITGSSVLPRLAALGNSVLTVNAAGTKDLSALAVADTKNNEVVTLSPFEVAKPQAGFGGGGGGQMSGTTTIAAGSSISEAPLAVSDLSQVVKLEAFSVTGGEGSSRPAPVATAPTRPPAIVRGANVSTKKAKAAEEKQKEADLPVAHPAPKPPPDATPADAETSTAKDPVSTFSLHVSDVSFRLASAALARGEAPDASRIRPEEFYNAVDYGDPTPTPAEKISCRIEQSAHPVLQQRNLVRIAMKVAATGRDAGTPLRLTVLLDTSGSMEREDRAATVRRALEVLISLLGRNDRITLIGFARTPRLLAESVAGNQAGFLADLAARTPAEGGTNIEEALKLAGELARRQRDSAAQNRIVMLTDGAANLGNAEPEQLATAVDALRQQGIAFDACGVGLDGLDDDILESLTRKGDGRYYALNSPADADAGFARQLAGAFRPAAENVKLQVRFNPARVGSYRLIGFEQHRLRAEDFRNDKVDAAELAAEEAAVALYQVEALPQGDGELGEVFVRFRDPATGSMVERSWPMSYDAHASAFDRATPSLQLAGTAALLAEKLRGGTLASQIKLADLAPIVNTLRSHYAAVPRVQELATMFAQTRRLTHE